MMNRIELKQEAKGVVRTAAVSAYLFALLYLALTELLQGASVYVNGDVALYMQTYFPNVPIPSYLYPVALPTTVVTLVAVVCWLLRVLLQGGWVLYHLVVRRGEEMPYATLFDGFGFIGKLILLNIVITLYVFLWSMLFIIPGFPFITSGIDLAKLDMRSGLERLAYAIVIILVATVTAWIMALLFHLKPMDFPPLHLSAGTHLLLRLITSFGGVFGFSIMFNSPCSIAAAAAFIGAIANTLRLELVDFVAIPPAAAAFIGALTAGILASLLKNKLGYPRISITVPAIVIMVPGLYLYN